MAKSKKRAIKLAKKNPPKVIRKRWMVRGKVYNGTITKAENVIIKYLQKKGIETSSNGSLSRIISISSKDALPILIHAFGINQSGQADCQILLNHMATRGHLLKLNDKAFILSERWGKKVLEITIANPVHTPVPILPFPVVVNDSVNHPSHYTDGKIEVIDFIEDKRLGFNLGNCVKYVSRAGKKDPSKTIEDLKKAAWYLNREIDNLGKSTQSDDEAIFQRWWTSKNRPAAINHFELAYSGINMSQFGASEAIIGKFKLKRSHVGQNWHVTEWPQQEPHLYKKP